MPLADRSSVFDAIGAVDPEAAQAPAAPSISFPALEGGGAAAPLPEKPKAPPVLEQKRRIGGKEDLGLVSAGVQWVESRNTPDAVGPETKTGRAFGLMGIQEATAAELGAKDDSFKTDGNVNRELGEKYLAGLHEKYGNWDDALSAYNAGPAKIDDWIAKGRPDGELAKQVNKYVNSVLGHANLDSPARRLIAAKGTANRADIDDLLSDVSHPSSAPETPTPGVPDPSAPYGEAPEDEEGFVGAYNAFAAGAAKELLNVPFGAAQAVLEQVAPEQAQKLTDYKNKLDERYAGAADAHPYVGFAGQVFGMTAGIMGAGGLVTAGAKALIPQVAALSAKVPLIARGAAGGTAAGGLQFNPNADPNDRLWEAPIGGIFGTLGGAFAKGAAWTLRHIVDATAQKTFIDELSSAAQTLGPNVSKVKDAVLDTLGAQDAAMRASVQKAQLLSTELGAQARQAVEEEKGSPAIRAIARQVQEIMGVRAEEARRAAAKVEQDRFDEAMTKWRDKIKKAAGPNAGPTLIQAHINRAIAKGDTPPVAPAPYAEQPISGANYAKGMQYLNTVWRQTRDPATKGAIARLIRGMEGTAGAAVRDAGGRYVSAQPLRGAFAATKRSFQERFGSDWQTARGAEQISPARFYDWVKDVVRRGDWQEIDGLRRVIGSSPEAQKALTNDILHQMLMDAGPNAKGLRFDPTRIHQYILDHGAALRHLLPKEEYAKLEGYARISQRIAEDGLAGRVASHTHRFFGWSGFLGIMGLEHALRGHVAEGAMLAASGFLAHTLYNFTSRIGRMQNVGPLIVRAGRLRPESRELDEVISKIMHQYAIAYGVAGRIVGQESQTLH